MRSLDKYQDSDFGYDPKSNKDRRQEFKTALEEARHNFGRIIRSVAYNSTPACRICALDEVYQDAIHSGEGDTVTVQELEHFRFLELFSKLAPDFQELERKKEQRRDLEGRDRDSREVRQEMDDVDRTIDALSRSVDRDKEELNKFRHSPEWDSGSPKMVVERTKYVCGGEGPGDRDPRRPGRPRHARRTADSGPSVTTSQSTSAHNAAMASNEVAAAAAILSG